MTFSGSKSDLRRRLRAARRQLSPARQREAAHGLVRRFRSQPSLSRARSIGVYFANDGELDPALLARWCWASGKQVFLPVLHPQRRGELLFLAWEPATLLARNRFGIPEPVSTRRHPRPLWTLDVLLTPLVGFDSAGGRLGMGGGFYDRTLGRLSARTGRRRPRVLGVAHDCQEIGRLPCDPWDIPLEGVVTGTRFVGV